MVTETLNGATVRKWTSDTIRSALRQLCDTKNWTTNRLAAELAMSQVGLEAFLNGDVPTMKLRNKATRLLERWGVDPPEVVPAPEPLVIARSEWAREAASVDHPAAETVAGPEPEPMTLEYLQTLDWDNATLAMNPDWPFPMGFSVVWHLPATALNTPAIRLAKTGILVNKALRDQMGSPDAVMVALWRDKTTCRLAVANAVDGFESYAIRLPKSGEIAQRVRTVHIGPVVPDGTYPVTKEGDCWITGEIALNPVEPTGALA